MAEIVYAVKPRKLYSGKKRSINKPISQKSKEVHSKLMTLRNLLDNPTKNPESVEKANMKKRGRKLSDRHKKKIGDANRKRIARGDCEGLFKKGRIVPDKDRENASIRMLKNNISKRPDVRRAISNSLTGRKKKPLPREVIDLRNRSIRLSIDDAEKERRRIYLLVNNPMKNPEFRKKAAIEKMKAQDRKIEPIKEDILKSYSGGLGFWETAKKYHLGGRYLKRLLKDECIKIRSSAEQTAMSKGSLGSLGTNGRRAGIGMIWDAQMTKTEKVGAS